MLILEILGYGILFLLIVLTIMAVNNIKQDLVSRKEVLEIVDDLKGSGINVVQLKNRIKELS